MDQFQGQQLMDLRGVVLVSLEVALHDSFDAIVIQIWPGQRFGIQQYLTNVF